MDFCSATRDKVEKELGWALLPIGQGPAIIGGPHKNEETNPAREEASAEEEMAEAGISATEDLVPEIERTIEVIDVLEFKKYIGFHIFDKILIVIRSTL